MRMNLLFDLGGTLTDPKEGIVGSIHHAMRSLGKPLPAGTDLDWCIGPPLAGSFETLLGGQAHVEEALALYRHRFKEKGMFENRPYPGIAEALTQLQPHANLYVATSKPTVFAEQILRHFGLAPFFVKTYGSELDGRHSDKADLIRHILAQESLAPRDTFMIGDRKYDIQGALANNVRAIGVAWGYGSREELVAAGAKVVVGQTQELLQALFDPGT